MKTAASSFYGHLLFNRKTRFQLLIAGTFVFAGIVLLFCKSEWYSFSEQWGLWLEAYISIATLVVVVFVWYNEQKEEYLKSLPKKLNVTYKLNGKDYVVVKNAPLSGEGDIRTWGQSIAKTIVNDKTNIDFSGHNIEVLGAENKAFYYHITIYLNKSIAGVKEGAIFEFDNEGQLKTHQNLQPAPPAPPTSIEIANLIIELSQLSELINKKSSDDSDVTFLKEKQAQLEKNLNDMKQKFTATQS